MSQNCAIPLVVEQLLQAQIIQADQVVATTQVLLAIGQTLMLVPTEAELEKAAEIFALEAHYPALPDLSFEPLLSQLRDEEITFMPWEPFEHHTGADLAEVLENSRDAVMQFFRERVERA